MRARATSICARNIRALFERVWKAELPGRPGLNLLQMMDAAARGSLKALWAFGYDVLLTNANTHATREALRALELVIVQDMFLNETAREFGSVFLPAASSFEKDGTFMNADRRVQRVRKLIEPVGESRSDGEILCAVARAMGKGEFFDYRSAEQTWDEVRAVWPAGHGMTYRRLEGTGLQWPCPSEDHPGTRLLHADTFPVGRRAALRRVKYRPTPEAVSEEFPFLLVTGRTLYQFNAGTTTLRTPNVAYRPADVLDVSPEDAQRLGLAGGAGVRVKSRYGEAVLSVNINAASRPGSYLPPSTCPRFVSITSPGRTATATPKPPSTRSRRYGWRNCSGERR